MSAAAHKTTDCDAFQGGDQGAACELIQEIREAFVSFAPSKLNSDELFCHWDNWMENLRSFEKKMLKSGPSPTELRTHKELVEFMISFANATLSAAQTRENSSDQEKSETASIAPQIELLQRYKWILEFEMKGWHGNLSREQLEEISRRMNGIPDAKAA